MPNTRGSLAPAVIVNLADESKKVTCMFNPNDYTLTKQNQWKSKDAKGRNVPKVEFEQGGAQQLKLQLFFDTYAEKGAEGADVDVRQHTDELWKMMMVAEDRRRRNNKSRPPLVEFRWGRLTFKAVITNLSQKFTLFNKEGVPLRTTVDVTFQQVADDQDPGRQNPTSGGGPPLRVHVVQAGDRLDLIAAKVYGDAAHWRRIAQANGLLHPLRLREGQALVVPALE